MNTAHDPSGRLGGAVAPLLGDRPLRTVVVLVGIWTAVGCFAGVQFYIQATLAAADASLGASILEQTLSALAWVPATLVAIALTRRFPVRTDAWRGPLAVHAAAAVGLAGMTNVLMGVLHGAANPTTAGRSELWTSSLAGVLRWGHIDLLVYALIAGIAHAVRRRSEDRDRALRTARLEAELTRANLRALKLQLQPHFLFNTLHTIGALWRTGRPHAAEDTLDRLSTLLRRVLDPAVGQEVTVEEELDFTREYLAVEKVRFGDRLRVEIEVDENALDAYLPSFVLQPLVENAVRHGIGSRAGGGRLRISARRAGGELQVDVVDDGAGAPSSYDRSGAAVGSGDRASAVAERAGESRGVGLDNTRRRLSELYGGDRLELTSAGADGTRVTLRIPYRTDAPPTDDHRRADAHDAG